MSTWHSGGLSPPVSGPEPQGVPRPTDHRAATGLRLLGTIRHRVRSPGTRIRRRGSDQAVGGKQSNRVRAGAARGSQARGAVSTWHSGGLSPPVSGPEPQGVPRPTDHRAATGLRLLDTIRHRVRSPGMRIRRRGEEPGPGRNREGFPGARSGEHQALRGPQSTRVRAGTARGSRARSSEQVMG